MTLNDPLPRSHTHRRWRLGAALLIATVIGAGLAVTAWVKYGPRTVTVSAGAFPEQLVYARSSDDVINGGALFHAPGAAGQLAVIWVHGWSANFYSPTYTAAARALASRGVPTLTVNTRMHDLGTSATHRNGRRVRGGGYWGVTSEQTLDIAAWIDLAEQQGFRRVVLVGHSAGWGAVAAYQVERKDPRVAGLVLASGPVRPLRPDRDPPLLEQARAHLARGAGDELLKLPSRNFPSYVSAATYLDMADAPAPLLDFFGVERQDGAIVELRRPLLAFFGTRGDVGDASDLDIVKATPRRLSRPEILVDTVIIARADHMYTGEEAQVADVIAAWIHRTLRTPTP